MSTSDKFCNVGASIPSDDGICEMNDMLQKMSTADKDILVCANCGKEGANNICNKCKMVKYCNAACKKKHRHKHKKDCEEYVRLAAERATELHDEKLFKQPPPAEDCPICFLLLPAVESGSRYYSCCGKVICSGCSYAPVYDEQGNEVDNEKCPFCRTPNCTSDEEAIERYERRMQANDAEAIHNLGDHYARGMIGYPDYAKALEFWHRAAELGYAKAYCKIGCAYYRGEGVKIDEKKAVYYCELAAISGCNIARYNLGIEEENAGNMERALKHHMIAVIGGDSGDKDSLKEIKQMYTNGYAHKDDYTKALQSYQAYLGDIKSSQRDKASAVNDHCRYY